MKKTITIVLLLGVGLWGWTYYGSYVEKNEVVENKVVQESPMEAGDEPENETPEQEIKESESEIIESEKPVVEKKPSSSELSTSPKNEPTEPKTEVKKLSPQQMEAKIINKYSGQFSSLKNEFEGKIHALIDEAKAEYYGIPEADRSDAKWSLGLKYLKKGKALEEACDDRFNKILDQMKAELKANHLSDEGVKAAQEQYNSEKSARRKTLLSKAMGKG